MTEVALLGDLVTIRPSRSSASDGDVQVATVTSGCLTPAGFDAGGVRPNLLRAEDVEAATIQPNEILVSRSNTEDLVGRAALYPGWPAPLVATDLVFRLVSGPRLDPSYGAYYLASLQAAGWWRDRSSGASSTSGMPLVTENAKDARRFTRGHPDLNLLDYQRLLAEIEKSRLG